MEIVRRYKIDENTFFVPRNSRLEFVFFHLGQSCSKFVNTSLAQKDKSEWSLKWTAARRWSRAKLDGHMSQSGRQLTFVKTAQFHPFEPSTFIPCGRLDSLIKIIRSFPLGPYTFGFQDRPPLVFWAIQFGS